ncbi:MAG TPA: DUF1569 domain-containing protein [Tepidisphaeraceae bacterium]|jgi:hypothetical protein
MNPARRPLRYERLQDVMPDVDSLLIGHRTVGRWSLGQMCNHLAWSIACSVDGFPGWTWPWVLRRTVGATLKKLMFANGRIMEGAPLPKKMRPIDGLDASAEAQQLREAIERFSAMPVPQEMHPMMGRLTREQWERFHCIHCAHHLSFALPQTSPTVMSVESAAEKKIVGAIK